MARRIRKSLWPRSLRRALRALTRATWRAGTRAATQATARTARVLTTPTRPRRTPRAGAGDWLAGVAIGPTGPRRYRLYRGPGARAGVLRPLLVMLHGCDQDAAGFARSTQVQRVAAREGFMVLCPEQERLANAHRCWNWFEMRSGRAQAEAASILAAIDQVCALHGADPARVAIAGLSAGASMAALVALHHPGRFRALAMHSGVAPGAAHSAAGAVGAMRGRRHPDPLPAHTPALPPLLVIQGSADHVVDPGNGRTTAQWWADAVGATAGPPRIVQRGARRAATLTDFRRGTRLVATLCEVAGLGHAWSGGAVDQPYSDAQGPDAARMIWAFAARCFAQASAGPPGATKRPTA